MMFWDAVRSWYRSGEFEELRLADQVQQIATFVPPRDGQLWVRCPTCHWRSYHSEFSDYSCLRCGWKPSMVGK